MICRVLISSNVRELGFVKSHHMWSGVGWVSLPTISSQHLCEHRG
nr:MAG TPA: hypothetical protein [Caudoviricetes sp.]